MTSEEEKREQKRKQEQKKRSLHQKHKERRKKDLMPNLPFIIGFQGDPARDFACNDENQRDENGRPDYELVPRRKRELYDMAFRRLSTYFFRKMTRVLCGKILVYKAS